MNIRVRVTDDLVLDAGALSVHRTSEVAILPPKITLFHQVLDYLRSTPLPASRTELTVEDEGAATAAVVLRWGSYFAVLADDTKQVWTEARSPDTSRVSDAEMARINIEASAALAEWVDICRRDRSAYEALVIRALAYLPLPKLRVRPSGLEFAALGMKAVASKIVAAVDPAHLARIRPDAESHGSRVFANALVNVAWRNGPIEPVHAGRARGYPLDRRRFTSSEVRNLLGFAADRLATGMDVCRALASEVGRSWPEQVVPYCLAGPMLITPSGWTLTEATRAVHLRVE